MTFNPFLHCLKQGLLRDVYKITLISQWGQVCMWRHAATCMDCEGPFITACSFNYCIHFSLSQMIAFFTAWPWMKIRFYLINLLSSWIFTTRWHYNQGKCVLANTSYIICYTFKNLISMRSLNCAQSGDISHAHPLTIYFCKGAKCQKPTFTISSKRIPPICTKLCTQHHWTVGDRALCKESPNSTQDQSYRLINFWRNVQKQEVLHISTIICPIDMKLGSVL